MATPLYKFPKNGLSTYAFPSAARDISQANQNPLYKMNFSKFILLKLDLDKIVDSELNFNTESPKVITDKGETLINYLRNYVANNDETITSSLLNNNQSFYDPNELRTVSERIFWKWMRKSGQISLEPAIPNQEYVESLDFAIDENLPSDYFKEYVWKERSVIQYDIIDIEQETFDSSILDPKDNIYKNRFKISISSSTNIKPNDTIQIVSDNIGFIGKKEFNVVSVATLNNDIEKNNTIFILSDIQLIWNNSYIAKMSLVYDRVVKYIGEINSISNIQNKNNSYTEINALIPDQTGQTPDILFRLVSDKNYSPSLQFPILPSQDQPEIVGGEQSESPINLKPSEFPGDQYGIFDVDNKYQLSSGQLDRRSGEYYGIYEDSRKKSSMSAPYTYPAFDGSKLDGMTIDFDPIHYVKMNLPTKKSNNFDEFNAQTFNNEPPKDFEFNAILWYYDIVDESKMAETETVNTVNSSTPTSNISKTTITKETPKVNQNHYSATNLYGISIFANKNEDSNIEEVQTTLTTIPKLVANGKQDGLSYSFNLNFNYEISNDNTTESFDPEKVYSLYGQELYNNVYRRMIETLDIFLETANVTTQNKQDIQNLYNLIYTQTDLNDINFKIESLYNLLNIYQNHQISDSDSISVSLETSVNPPVLKLNSTDPRYSDITNIYTSTMYNILNNTVLNNKITVPNKKDFMINIINNDNADIILDNNLNIVLSRDLDYKQTLVLNIYPDNCRYDKKLNIKIIDNTIISNLSLPIDSNLNPNIETTGISKRISELTPTFIYPTKVGMKKIGDTYYIILKLNDIQTNIFKSGDVIYLDSKFSATNIIADGTGQYTIVGDIDFINSEISIVTKDPNMIKLYIELKRNQTNTQFYIENVNIDSPIIISINRGYTISITNVNKSANDKYLIDIRRKS